MASTGVLLFIFTVLYICEGNLAFLNVHCTNKMGQHGKTSLLECVVIPKQDVADVQIRVVTWKKKGEEEGKEPLLVFNRGELTQLPRYSFAEPSWNNRNMNVSLLIAKTDVKDNGVYECMVMTSIGAASDDTSLEVTAKYSTPTIHSKPETGVLNAHSALVCNSVGGYPEGRLRWFDEHNVDWTESADMEANQTESGLFQLSSTLTLFKRSIFSKYTCVVFNASGDKDSEATYEIPDKPQNEVHSGHGQGKDSDSVSKIVAPLVVIGSLIVGLLLAVLLYRRRSQQARRHSTSPLVGHHQEVPSCELNVEEGYQEMDIECQDTKA